MRQQVIPGWWRVRHRGWVLALLGLLAGIIGSSAWSQSERGLPAGGRAALAAWEACRARSDSLTARRDALLVLADSLAAARRSAVVTGQPHIEARLLAQGEAVAESTRAVAAAQLAQELLCARLAAALEAEIEAALGGEAALPPAAGDSLLRLAARVRAVAARGTRTGFTVPPVQEDDPPEVLRQVAAYAQDLADRAGRWLRVVQATEQEIGDRERILREAEQLMDDERFFDPGGGLDLLGWDGVAQLATEAPEPGEGHGLLASLIAAGAALPEAGSPLAILRFTAEWLAARRAELLQQAEDLEAEAMRREREP